jgi:hypothetical protein
MIKDNTPLNRWKPINYKKDVIDTIVDLFFDVRVHLQRSKHIQNIQNLFKRKPVKEHKGFLKLHSPNIYEEIKIQEIKEIKFEKEIQIQDKKSKQKKTVTHQTEPSVEDVVKALSVEIDYKTIIVNFFVNILMFVPIILIGTVEVFKFLGTRFYHYLKLIASLPFRQVFSIAFRFSIVIVAIGFSIFLFNYFRSVSTAQEMNTKWQEAHEKWDKKEHDLFDNQNKLLKEENKEIKAKLDAGAVIIKHEYVDYRIYDKQGKLHQGSKLR